MSIKGFQVGAFLLMWLVILIQPFYSWDHYSLVSNTTSHLGAQHAPNGWIMNIVFAWLGVSVLLVGWKYFRKFALQRFFLRSLPWHSLLPVSFGTLP